MAYKIQENQNTIKRDDIDAVSECPSLRMESLTRLESQPITVALLSSHLCIMYSADLNITPSKKSYIGIIWTNEN